MSEPIWKLLPPSSLRPTDVVMREWPDGRQESCLVTAPEYVAWLEAGNTPLPAAPPVSVVPSSVTSRQVRLLLLSQGLLSQVEAIIAASDEATKITWAYASEFRRNDPLLEGLSEQLGLTSEQVDGFFIAAAAI